MTDTKATTAAPAKEKDPGKSLGVSEGDMRYVAADGQAFSPVACGVHNAEGAFHEPPKGYQPDCINCHLQLENCVQAWYQSSATEFGAGDERRGNRSQKAPEGDQRSASEVSVEHDEDAAKAGDQLRSDDPSERKLLRRHGVNPDEPVKV